MVSHHLSHAHGIIFYVLIKVIVPDISDIHVMSMIRIPSSEILPEPHICLVYRAPVNTLET